MSFLAKHSSARVEDDTTIIRREPSLREKMGPYFCENGGSDRDVANNGK
ncbi:hypothetical protein COLO4_09029 [Corchorus olitorius]|uniref:Uncharacterized protein n=1 Tax=Corchorus olitorius TaxID=93759 RepID=A0A1R3KDK7_9ROSI|nr:hypothetical protein COLO4_09029 [Corchorus olitorius]